MPKTLVPITPEVLEWAIDESGFDLDEVASAARVSVDVLVQWMTGIAQPGITEFKHLATKLHRQRSVFLLPEPPKPSTPQIEFRDIAGTPSRMLNPVERRYLRRARRLQEMLAWLSDELDERRRALPRYSTSDDAEQVAAAARALLRIKVEDQQRWPSASKAFDHWRAALESIGNHVFLFPLGSKSCRGFSLWHENAPLIAVNTAWREEARIYTLFHEFGHLLTRSNSACVEWAGKATRARDPVERWCERFAAALLLPRESVLRALPPDARKGRVRDLRVPSAVANRFRVSLRAATLRLIELRLADWDLYEEIPDVADNKPPGGGGGGRNRLEIREDEFGARGTAMFVRAVKNDVLSRSQALDYLDIPDPAFDQLAASPHSQ